MPNTNNADWMQGVVASKKREKNSKLVYDADDDNIFTGGAAANVSTRKNYDTSQGFLVENSVIKFTDKKSRLREFYD